MMDEQKSFASIPITKKHFNSMGHKINTDKLRDMLREKCRIRVRESRHNKFDVSRQFLENEKQWLTSVLREMDLDIEFEESILKELIDEQYEWMLERYDSPDEDLEDPKPKLVMCPICQLSELRFSNHVLRCDCGFEQNYIGSLDDFWKSIQKKVCEHEEKCLSKLSFFMDPNEAALNVTCHKCDFLAMIE